MRSYIACTLALIAALSQVSADSVTTSAALSSCSSNLNLKTYTDGIYAARGSDFVNTAGAKGTTVLVNEGGKFFLKADGKYFCDSQQDWHGGYKVTPSDYGGANCEVEVRDCDKVGDRLYAEPPKPNCIAFFFTGTNHYLSAGLTDNTNQGVQSQTWCRTWEYHYADCPAGSGGGGYGDGGYGGGGGAAKGSGGGGDGYGGYNTPPPPKPSYGGY